MCALEDAVQDPSLILSSHSRIWPEPISWATLERPCIDRRDMKQASTHLPLLWLQKVHDTSLCMSVVAIKYSYFWRGLISLISVDRRRYKAEREEHSKQQGFLNQHSWLLLICAREALELENIGRTSGLNTVKIISYTEFTRSYIWKLCLVTPNFHPYTAAKSSCALQHNCTIAKLLLLMRDMESMQAAA